MSYRELIIKLVFVCVLISAGYDYANALSEPIPSGFPDNNSNKVEQLNTTLKSLLTNEDLVNSKTVVGEIVDQIDHGVDEVILSESYYLIGIYYLKSKGYNEAIRYLDLCVSIKEKRKENDGRYAKALYNLGVAYRSLADLNKFEYYALKSLEIGKEVYSESDKALPGIYLAVSSLLIELREYEKGISNINTALAIIERNPENADLSILKALYYNLGVCYARQADFSKAKMYFDKTDSFYKNYNLSHDNEYLNLMNSLGYTCNSLGLTGEAENCFENGVNIAVSLKTSLAYNFINTYSLFLASTGKTGKGEKLLKDALARAKADNINNQYNYFEVLNNYAGYLRENKIDNARSIECYLECLAYLEKNDKDPVLKASVYTGYAKSLKEAGESENALIAIQSLLFPGKEKKGSVYENPSIETLKPDLATPEDPET